MSDHFAGAINPFAMLQGGGNVAGIDYVGAASRTPMAYPGLHLAPAAQAAVAAQNNASSYKMQALQQLAMAQYVPQILLGIGDTTTKVKAGAAFSFSPEGSVPLRITQLTVASSIAPFFVITQFTVARLNLLAGSVGVPAENFIPNARHPPLEIPILAAGSQVVVAGSNFDTADHFFTGAVMAIDLTTASARMIP